MKRRYAFLIWALLGLGTACLKDPEAPMNQPDTPTISVDEPSVARVSMLVKGSFGHKLEDITSYGVEFSDVLFEKDGTYTVLTPQEVTEDGFSLGITNLTPNKTYYLRSFISNGHSSLYSSVLTQKMPETSVASVSDVSLSADGNHLVAMIEDDGGRSVEDVGFVWGDTNDRRALRREKRYPATIGLDGRTFTLPVSALGNKTRYVLAYAEDDKEATGFSRIALERFVAEPEPEPEPSPTQPYNEIWYTSSTGEVIQPTVPDAFNTRLVSNTYEDGKGVMVFEEDLISIDGWGAFQNAPFTSIQLPGKLESISDFAFIGCSNLGSVHIPESVTSFSIGCFQHCERLSSFTGKYASSDQRALIVDGIMIAFASYNLSEYTVLSGVKGIGYGVFNSCLSLTKITLPEGLETTHVGVFGGCENLREVHLPSTLTTIGQAAFASCTSLTTIDIPQSVTVIGPYAFDSCTSLTSFTGKYASQDGRFLIKDNTLCGIALSGMTEVIIPDGIQSACSIFYAQELKRVEYPETIISMGHVYECHALNSIVVKATNPPRAELTRYNSNGDPTFLKESNNCPIYVPAESVEAYKAAEYWSAYADRIQPIVEGQPTNEIWYTSTDGEIVTPNSSGWFNANIISNTYVNGKGIISFDEALTKVGDFAFYNCSNLASIQLPNALRSIEGYAFCACFNLETIYIPNSVTSISDNQCFSNCWNLSSFTGQYASADGKSLIIDGIMVGFAPADRPSEYTVDSSVKVLGAAFADCSFLTKVNLPEGLEELRFLALGHTGIREITFPSTTKYIRRLAFSSCRSLSSLDIPESVIEIEKEAFWECYGLSSLMGKYASEDGHYLSMDGNIVCLALAGLEEYTIPEGITTTCCVDRISGIKRITYPSTITQMGQISYCEDLESITVIATTPPTFTREIYHDTESTYIYNSNNCLIYVPSESVDSYKTAEGWSDYADRIQPIQEGITPSKYLTFTSEGTTTVSLSNQGHAPVLYYSFDKTNWTQWDYSEISFTASKPLFVCGDNDYGFNPENSLNTHNIFTASGDTFAISGDIMSLLNKDEDMTAIPGDPNSSAISRCFYELFRDCTILTSGPSLPATKLSPLCYSYMFSGCTGLTSAPELPATTLSSRCYDHMFEGCAGLSEAPALASTQLSTGCYANMFQDCTGLTSAPELPSTSLVGYCYDGMFQGCTGLRVAPSLPALSIGMYSYKGMFSGCTSLVEPPELPATTFSSFECYEEMFKGCTSLVTAPELPCTSLTTGCYTSMFEGCTSLTTAPALPATRMVRSCYESMFKDCTSLVNAPELPATSFTEAAYKSMFMGCTSLTTAPALPATELVIQCYMNMFTGCTSLTQAPALPATTLIGQCYCEMFKDCTSLTTAPELPAEALVEKCYSGMFRNCSKLNYVKCMATSINSYHLDYWLYGVASTGTYVKAANVEWPSGANGIPEGWTVEEL